MARPDQTISQAVPEMNAAVAAWGDWGSTFARNMRAWNEEVAQFMGKRLEHDGRTLTRLANCGDLGEMARVQQEWFSETTEQYMRESRRLSEIAMANGAGKPAGPRV
jgi:hypothetical protein